MLTILHKPLHFLLTALVLLTLAFAFNNLSHSPVENVITEFQSELFRKENKALVEINALSQQIEQQSYESVFKEKSGYYAQLAAKEGIVFLIYENDTLKFWSDNSVAVENYQRQVCLDNPLTKLKNGWFEVMHKRSEPAGTKAIFALLRLKNEYTFQNKYLQNNFGEEFQIGQSFQLFSDSLQGKYNIYNSSGRYLCSLSPESDNELNSMYLFVAVFLFACSLIVSIGWLLFFVKTKKERSNYNWWIVSAVLLVAILRWLSIHFQWPGFIYELELFSPRLYGDANSVWLFSLGDLFINAFLLCFVTYYFVAEVKITIGNPMFVSTLLVAFILVYARLVISLSAGLIENSNISFNVNNLFALNYSSYVGLITMAMLTLSLFVITDKVVKAIIETTLPTIKLFTVLIVLNIGYMFYCFSISVRDEIIIFWPSFLFLLLYIYRKRFSTYSFTYAVVILIAISFFSGYLLNKYVTIKERESRKILAERLSAEQDPLAEYLLQKTEQRMTRDASLADVLVNSSQFSEFEKNILQKYFSGYWERYKVRVYAFDTLCLPLMSLPENTKISTSYFDGEIADHTNSIDCNYFYSVNDDAGKLSFLGRVPIRNSLGKKIIVYLQMDARYISDEQGFPELLLDREIGVSQQLTQYSYAKYYKGSLVNRHGKFPYTVGIFEECHAVNDFFESGGYNHLVYKPQENIDTEIIISKKNDTYFSGITIFSYLFSFYSMALLLVGVLKYIIEGVFPLELNFKNRIQYVLILIVLLSFILFGAATTYYLRQQFGVKNSESIREKIMSVLTEVEMQVGADNAASHLYNEYMNVSLKRLSAVFFTDINFFDNAGNLMSSSRRQVFDEGLMSRKMNPKAFYELAYNQASEYTLDERIGSLEFLSSYVPLKTSTGQISGFLNVPYFARQSELEKEISAFLVALINVYVFLFVLSVLLSVLVSNYVTSPLQLIQQKMSEVKLGRRNEIIDMREDDEIGSLVKEYNRMINELADSAEKLAKSERESAWREMARQVAHEIKNPLTPMKLSVQHLQRMLQDKSRQMDEQRVSNLTKTLIEQIDTLSNIAGEFSSFAQMPKANNQNLQLRDILETTVELYREQNEAEIHLQLLTKKEVVVFADKDQLIRVFNNLVKNAIQAIPHDRKGKIEVILRSLDTYCEVMIKDNGSGIMPEQISKIFVPNFTTKTGGMGLGLAMVKNIVEQTGGKIWFETKVGEGTSFFVRLPVL